MLADAFEPPHKVAEFRPEAFGRVHVDLVDAVAVVVPCPFTCTVADGRMVHPVRPHPVVRTAFVGVTGAGVAPVPPQGLADLCLCGVVEGLKAHLPALTAYRPVNGRSVVCPCAQPFFLLARHLGGSSSSVWGMPFSPAFWNTSSLSVTESGSWAPSLLKWALPIRSWRRYSRLR